MGRRKLDGVLLLDKPVGPSSSAVLQAVKRLLNAEKAGHAGTLVRLHDLRFLRNLQTHALLSFLARCVRPAF